MKKGIAALVGAAVAASALFTACRFNVSPGDYFFDNDEEYTEFTGQTVELDEKNVTSLDLDWVAGEIEIREGEKLTVAEENLKGTYCPLYFAVKDGALCVKFCKSGTLGSVIGNCSKKVTVTLPEGMKEIKVNSVSAKIGTDYQKKLESVTVNTVSGDCAVAFDALESIKTDAVSANVDISVNGASSVVCNSVSGNAQILGSAGEVSAHSVSGDFKIIVNNKELRSVKIDTISGDAEIELDGSRDCSLEYNTVSGKLTNEVGEVKNASGDKIGIKVDSVSGNLNIVKNQD
ncbi:MAG: DUF4097 family beta strand repeat protein [Clostridia bacterium]|nr:DUF4097 family beta strand repeat protein [Clostridia bacterium]